MQQMAEEGVVQVFAPLDGGPPIIGVVGALQLDVLKQRMKVEYGLPVSFEESRFAAARWVRSDDKAEFDRFTDRHRLALASDLDGDPVFLAESVFLLNYEIDRWPKLEFTDIKDYQRGAAGDKQAAAG
jgi:peptide chain release factor 3